MRVRETTLRRLLTATVAAAGALLAANNLLPYAGLRDDSCQTMFSGLAWTARANNHLFMPQRALGDGWTYLDVTRAEVEPPPPPEGRARIATDWLQHPGRRRNVEAVRAAVGAVCAAGHRVRLTLSAGGRDETRDACAAPSLSRPSAWVPVARYAPEIPAGSAPHDVRR